MRFAGAVLFIAAVFRAVTCSATTVHEEAAIRTMALTFDDLPYAAAGADRDTLANAHRVTDAILSVIREYHAPVTAFVNEAKLDVAGDFEERRSLLQQWVDAGAVLGNHAFSHVDLNSVSIAEFKQEIIKGEIVTRQLIRSRLTGLRHCFTYPWQLRRNSNSCVTLSNQTRYGGTVI